MANSVVGGAGWIVQVGWVLWGLAACEPSESHSVEVELPDAAVADAEWPRAYDLGCAPMFQADGGCDPDPARCGPDEVPVVDEGCLKVGLPACAPEFLKGGRCRPEPADCAADEVPVPAEGCVRVGPPCAAVFVGADGVCRPEGCGELEVPVPSVGCVPVGPACRSLAAVEGSGIFVQAGAPAGDGSAARPLGSLAEALARAEPGGRVVVGPGRYEEPVEMPRGVTLEGVCAAEVVLAGRTSFGTFPNNGVAGVLLAPGSALRGVTIEGDVAVFLNRPGEAHLEGVRVRATGNGVSVGAGTLRIQESIIEAVGVAEIGALAVVRSRLELDRVLVRGPFGYGVDADDAEVVVADSLLVDGEGDSPWPRRGIVASARGHVTVRGSVVAGWQGCGVRSLGWVLMQDSAVLDGRWYPNRHQADGREARGGLCIDNATGYMRAESSIVRGSPQAGAGSAGHLELWRVRVEGTWDPGADEHGAAGVWFDQGTGGVQESLIVGNQDRGVLVRTPEAITIEDSVVAHNHREGDGVGLLFNPPTSGEGDEVRVIRSVLLDNGAFEVATVDRVLDLEDSVVVSRTPFLRPDSERQAIGLVAFSEVEVDERSPFEGWPGGGLRITRGAMEGQRSFGVVAWVGTGLWVDGLALRGHRASSGEGGAGLFLNETKAARLERLVVQDAEAMAIQTFGVRADPVRVDRAVIRQVARPQDNPDHLGSALFLSLSDVAVRGLDARDLVGAAVIVLGRQGDDTHLELHGAHLARVAPGFGNNGLGIWSDHARLTARGVRIEQATGVGLLGVGRRLDLHDVTIASVALGGGSSVVGAETRDAVYLADAAYLTGSRVRSTDCGVGLRLSTGAAAEVSHLSTACDQSAILQGQTTLEADPPLVPPPITGESELAGGLLLPEGFTDQAEAPRLDPPR